MAQGNPTVLKIRTEIENLQGLNQLKTAVRRISAEAKGANNDFGRLTGRIKELQGATVKSVNNLEAQKQAFEALRRSVDVTSREFKSATDEIKKLDQQLAKVEGRKAGGGRLRAGAQVAGTIAGAGVFGGPEGAVGAAVGGIFGGVPGAIAGGVIGAQVGGIRQAAGAAADYSANLQKLRIALQGVTTSQNEYSAALDIIQRSTRDFAIPQDVLTRQFTRLQASVQGAGGNINDTETAFKGIVAAVRATGGSLADVDAALTATAQVFSKGKVSAEELRQQIGERLPGAFTLFAESIGKTPQELDKALEGGKISLQDFQTFAESLFERYGETAKIIADGPESAGDRLKVALANLSESVGTLLAPIGAAFQETFIGVINIIDQAARKLNDFFGLSRDKKLSTAVQEVTRRQTALTLFEQRTAGAPLTAVGKRQRQSLQDALDASQAELRRIRDEIAIETEGTTVAQAARGSGLPGITEEDKAGKSRKKTDPMVGIRRDVASQFRDLEASFAVAAQRRLAESIAFYRKGIAEAQKAGDEPLVFQLRQAMALEKVKINISGLNEQIRQREKQIQEARRKGVETQSYDLRQLKDREALKRAELELDTLMVEQDAARFDFARKITEEVEKQRESFEQQFTDRQRELGLISDADYNQVLMGRERERLAQEFPGISEERRAQMLDLYRQEIDPTLFESMRQNITQLKDELRELVDPINQITGAATAIGDAFSQSFVDAISGSKTAKEALADFFQSVGSYFLDMAKQIIAQMIQLAILNAVTGLLPGLSGGGGGFSKTGFYNPVTGLGAAGPNFGLADGGTVMPGNTYMVGERGPELLQLNRNGSGQVINNNQLSSAMNRYRRSGSGATTTSGGTTESLGGGGVSVADKPIDVRYTVERINNVEYVTADQFQAGMREAAQQGAAQGERRTIQKLQMSPGARRRLGL